MLARRLAELTVPVPSQAGLELQLPQLLPMHYYIAQQKKGNVLKFR